MTEREHVTEGLSCWCGVIVLAYGDELVYDADGTLVEVRPATDDEDDR